MSNVPRKSSRFGLTEIGNVKKIRTHSAAVNETNNKRFAAPPPGFFLMNFSCRTNHLAQLDCINVELVVKVGKVEVEKGITTVGT